MLNVRDVSISKLEDSIYVLPVKMNYIQDNIPKSWDLIRTHQSVTIIIYNVTQNALVCVKQFRPGVYMNSIPFDERIEKIDTLKYPPSLGITLEFCAGIVDKDSSLEEIAVDEVYEECGYKISTHDLEMIKTYRSAVGVAGDITTLYYAQVTDEMKTGQGGGIEAESIEIELISMDKVVQLLSDEAASRAANLSGEFLFGLMWFYNRHTKNTNQI